MIRSRKLKKEFMGNVLTLVTGTTIAQALPIAIMPILTRLYTPEEFGVFALYLAITSVFAVIATARYELAIMQPRDDVDAASLVIVSLIISFIISSITLGIVYIFNQSITNFLGNPTIKNWLYCVPLAVLLTGIYQTFNYWSARKKKFKRLSLVRVLQGISTSFGQLSMKYGFGGSSGLILGVIAGQVISTGVFAKMVWKEDKSLLKQLSNQIIITDIKKYQKYPLFSSLGALLDSAALQMPVFILTKVFGSYTTGMFSLIFRALNLPMVLIAGSISQVLFQQILIIHNDEPEALYRYVLKIFFTLLMMTLPLIILMSLYGKEIFILVFGQNWAEAGKLAAPLSIAVAVRFAVSPLSMVLAMDHNLKKGFYWQLTYFITIVTTLSLATCFDLYPFVMIFVIHEVILYGLYLHLILRGCKTYTDLILT